MRIGFMVRNLNEKGGINVYTNKLIEHILKQDRADEFVFIYNDEKFLGRYSSYPNVKEVSVKAKNKLLWDQIKVPQVLRKEKVDVVFNPKLSIPLFTRSKKVLMIHGAEQFAVPTAFPLYDRIYVRIFMPLYGIFADKILTATKIGIDDLSKYLHLPKSKFTYVYEGVSKSFQVISKDKLKEVKAKYNLPDKFILFISGLTPLKNLKRVMKSYDIIAEKYDYNLVIAGFRKFKFIEDLEQVAKIKNSNKIKFCGFIPDEDLPAFYNLATLYIYPSLYEGFGLPVLEAFGSGCPVVTTQTGCTREVADGAAVLADPYSIDDITAKMELVLTDDKLRGEMIEKGLERVKHFSWEKCAAETIKVFHSLNLAVNDLSLSTNV